MSWARATASKIPKRAMLSGVEEEGGERKVEGMDGVLGISHELRVADDAERPIGLHKIRVQVLSDSDKYSNLDIFKL